jgi:hypothetical protein
MCYVWVRTVNTALLTSATRSSSVILRFVFTLTDIYDLFQVLCKYRSWKWLSSMSSTISCLLVVTDELFRTAPLNRQSIYTRQHGATTLNFSPWKPQISRKYRTLYRGTPSRCPQGYINSEWSTWQCVVC